MKKIYLVAFFLIIATVSFAQYPYFRFEFFNNAGGLNTRVSPLEIKDNEATSLLNVNWTLAGAIQQRKGYEKYNSTPVEITSGNATSGITGIFYFKPNDGTKYLVATTSEGYFYQSTNFNGIVSVVTSGLITSGSTWTANINDLIDFAIGNNELVWTISSGSDTPKRWLGGGGEYIWLDSTAPQAKYVEFHKNFWFLACNNEYPSRIWFSDILADTFPAINYFDVASNDGEPISGMFVQLDNLYITKPSSVYRLSGYNADTFVLERMVYGVGCISNASIQVVDNVAYFLSKRGFYAYDGGINVVEISAKIQPTLDTLNNARNIYCKSVHFQRQNQIWWTLSTAGQAYHNREFVYDYFHKAWTLYNIPINALGIAYDSSEVEQLYTAREQTGYIYKQDTSNMDDTEQIQSHYQTKWFRFPEMYQASGGDEKRFRLLKLYAKPQNQTALLNVETKTDGSLAGITQTFDMVGTGDIWGAFAWGSGTWGSGDFVSTKLTLDQAKNFLQVKFSHNSNPTGLTSGTTFRIDGFSIFAEPTGRI